MLTVQVLDAAGTVIHSQTVDPSDVGTNFENAATRGEFIDTPAARALYVASVEVCPWDCDRCNGD